jgi:ABC-type nitrate/sulfonate/bicarbonate transport system permease component
MIRSLMVRRQIPQWSKTLLRVSSIALLILGYEFLAHRQKTINPSDTTIPTFLEMGVSLKKIFTPENSNPEMFRASWFWQDFSITAARLFSGVGIGVVIATLVGTLMGCYKWVEHFFLWPLSMATRVPPTAMMAVFFALAGTGPAFFVVMIAFRRDSRSHSRHLPKREVRRSR